MDFKEAIKNHLDQMAKQDFAFAERYKLDSKNLNDCCAYIISQARKQAKNNCAAIEDSVVFGWAVHYYMEDDVKVDNSAKAKVSAPKEEKKTKQAEIKPLKALVSDKKNKGKCVELDMFSGF